MEREPPEDGKPYTPREDYVLMTWDKIAPPRPGYPPKYSTMLDLYSTLEEARAEGCKHSVYTIDHRVITHVEVGTGED